MFTQKIRNRFKILTPKLTQQRVPIAPAQGQAGNTPHNLLNEFVKWYTCSVDQKKLYKKNMRIWLKLFELYKHGYCFY